MTMTVEKSVECTLAVETEVLGENLPHCHFVDIGGKARRKEAAGKTNT
jgi:hypothetical protein